LIEGEGFIVRGSTPIKLERAQNIAPNDWRTPLLRLGIAGALTTNDRLTARGLRDVL
jgi:hypothetical protein